VLDGKRYVGCIHKSPVANEPAVIPVAASKAD